MANCSTASQSRTSPSVINASQWMDLFNGSTLGVADPSAGIDGSDLRMEHLQYIVRNLQIYLAPCVATVGLIFNAVGVFAISRRPMLRFSTSHYVIAILVCDALQLAGVFQTWLNEFGLHLFFIGGWCQFSTFAGEVARFSSSWCLTALAFDRLICVRYPSVELSFCLPWVARVVILVIVVIGTVVYLNISLLYAVLYVGEHAICHVILAYTATVQRLAYADVFINSMVPCLLVVSFALTILGQLVYNRRLEANGSSLTSTYGGVGGVGVGGGGGVYARQMRRSLYGARLALSPEADADLNQERLVLAMLFAFIVLSLPYHSFTILDTVYSIDAVPSLAQKLHSYLIRQMLLHLRYVQMALDAFVLAGSHKLIRRRFAEKYLCRRCSPTDGATHELRYTHRTSFDQMSNDDSTIQIIQHEIQRSTATAV